MMKASPVHFNQGTSFNDAYSIVCTLLLVMSSMFFAVLFLTYVILRNDMYAWPPLGVPSIHYLRPLISTIFIGLSSASFHKCYLSFKNNNFAQSLKELKLTLFLSLAFLASQIGLYFELIEKGIYINSGVFASLIYVLTIAHALHILVMLGFLISAFFWVKSALDSDQKRREDIFYKLKYLGHFWHFLSLVWWVVYISLFVF